MRPQSAATPFANAPAVRRSCVTILRCYEMMSQSEKDYSSALFPFPLMELVPPDAAAVSRFVDNASSPRATLPLGLIEVFFIDLFRRLTSKLLSAGRRRETKHSAMRVDCSPARPPAVRGPATVDPVQGGKPCCFTRAVFYKASLIDPMSCALDDARCAHTYIPRGCSAK